MYPFGGVVYFLRWLYPINVLNGKWLLGDPFGVWYSEWLLLNLVLVRDGVWLLWNLNESLVWSGNPFGSNNLKVWLWLKPLVWDGFGVVDVFWLVNLNSYLLEVWLLWDVLNGLVLDPVPFLSINSVGWDGSGSWGNSWLNKYGVVIEWVVVIEVFIRYDWVSSPSWLSDWSWSSYDEIIVWIVVEVVSIG